MFGIAEVELKKRMDLADVYSLFIDFEPGVHTNSPFRNRKKGDSVDSTPSLIIDEFKGKLVWNDFGLNERDKLGDNDSLGFVQQLYGYKKREEAARYILQILDEGAEPVRYQYTGKAQIEEDLRKVKIREWFPKAHEYWKNLGISLQMLEKHNVYPLDTYEYDGKIVWSYRAHEPKYVYWFGKNRWQIYNPLSENPTYKFKTCNISDVVIGWDNLPRDNGGLLISKSMKDLLIWKTLGAKAVIAPMNEVSFKPLIKREETINNRFRNVYIAFDSDATGRANEDILEEVTNWQSLKLEFPPPCKDPGDVVARFGEREGYQLLKNILHGGLNKVNITSKAAY